MEAKLEDLDAELHLLALMRSKTDTVVEKGGNDKMARHREALRKIVANIEDLKLDIEKGKLESIEDVKAWGAKIEQTIDEVDLQVTDLTHCLEEVETREKNQKREEEEAILRLKSMQPIFPQLPNLPIVTNYWKVMFVNQLTACHLVLKVMNVLKISSSPTMASQARL